MGTGSRRKSVGERLRERRIMQLRLRRSIGRDGRRMLREEQESRDFRLDDENAECKGCPCCGRDCSDPD